MSEKELFALAAFFLILVSLGSFGMIGMWWPGMAFFMSLGAVVLFALAWILVKAAGGNWFDDPKKMLKERLAKGEVSLKEYEKLVRVVS